MLKEILWLKNIYFNYSYCEFTMWGGAIDMLSVIHWKRQTIQVNQNDQQTIIVSR